MTQLVTFARAIPPYGAGDTLLVPDALAEQLGDALAASKPWPPRTAPMPPTPQKPVRPKLKPTRSAGPPADQRVAEQRG